MSEIRPPQFLWVPGVPVGKRNVAHRLGKRAAVNITPETREYQMLVHTYGAKAGMHRIEAGPVGLTIAAVFPALVAKSKRDGQVAEWMLNTPDVSNVQKSVEDGLKGIAYRDDRQVVWVQSMKFRAPPPAEPGVIVGVYQLPKYIDCYELEAGEAGGMHLMTEAVGGIVS